MGAGAALGLGGGGGGTSTVMAFQFYGGLGDVTILVSKAGGRYRIQSDVLEAMWLIAGVGAKPIGTIRKRFEDACGRLLRPR